MLLAEKNTYSLWWEYDDNYNTINRGSFIDEFPDCELISDDEIEIFDKICEYLDTIPNRVFSVIIPEWDEEIIVTEYELLIIKG